MRFFIGHRLPLGFYGGISLPFRASRVLVSHGSAPQGPIARGLAIGIMLAILTGLLFALR